MNSKRSYLDSLNAGRQRRPYTSLEDLNRSLENLEQRLERNQDSRPDPYAPKDDFYARPRMPAAARPMSEKPYQSLARDLDRVRSQEDGIAAVGKIAGELKGLREELHHQMTAGLRREFDSLRSEIARAYSSPASARAGAELNVEFERLSGAIRELSERSDDRSVNLLRLKLEQVKAALDTLAREETVLSVDRRWDDFDRRWSAFEDRVSAGSLRRGEDPEIAALNARLEQINDAVNNLPESLSLQSLEEKVRMLAGAVDHFSRQQDRRGSDAFGQIEERLDEISRAIVASAVSNRPPHIDPQPFERIEARITSLARQLEELVDDRPNGEVIDRLNLLSQRVDELAIRAELPEQAVERLARQVASIGEKLDRAPQAAVSDRFLQGIEQRFDMLSDMLDRRQGDAIEHGQALFRDLERRLDEVAERLDHRGAAAMPASGEIMEAIDQRFNDFARKLEDRGTAASDDAIRGLEARLENISGRLDSSASQVAGIDPDLIRNLEAQVAGLSAHLARPSAPMPEFEDIAPRLVDIEKSIAGSRESILAAARQAAEDAVKSLAGSKTNAAAVAGLADDLKALETLTRRSDERNSKTFEAIHDTLLKIVDRLGSLETGTAEQPLPRKLSLDNAPSIEPGDTHPADPETIEPEIARGWGQPAVTRSPAEAAAAAAVAALSSTGIQAEQEAGGRVRTMLGGLSRAFGGKKEAEELPLAGSEEPTMEAAAPSVDLDEPLDPKIANRPLEPGSGAPDLSAIMKRVRDERGSPAKPADMDAAKSDFIAAARRAAQAAAAEADMLKKTAEGDGEGGRLKLGSLFRSKRKTMLLSATAIMLALAGMQLGKAFFADREVAELTAPDSGIQSTAMAPAAPQAAQPAQDVADTGGSASPVRTVDATERSPLETASPATEETAAAMPADTPEMEASAAPQPEAATATATLKPELQDEDGAAADLATASTPAPAAPVTTATASPILVPVEAGPVPLREAAEAGDSKAIFEIGSRYADGRGVKSDMKQAAGWYEKSAELGFAPAQYRIGNLYEKGLGVTRDVAKAKTWYQMAAAQGNASAMHNLAVLFAMGADGVADNDSAARWFTQAAELGVKDSQFNLGILAAKGVGMIQNLEESYKWFALVAKAGDRDAAAKRDEIARALRPEQLEKARAVSELWKPKAVNAETNSVEIPESWQESNAKTASIDMKQVVQNMQRILNKNGYDAGSADGVMGAKTKAAIATFQGDNGMDATGEVDDKLVRLLLEKK
ncbi:localization factor PodJL [Mesorhizobium albiziae]|uniref:Localization factor PodJL n=1 Tax=Neomesorhizobium albiziae TaxID=335020 RepID=A0A1I4CKV6_9HYPH|nr:peptidoglycan-binding protein [Mesorhizobium albiziae]GLS29339.1 peptidoglycan-binding protein [Mesorhizobium albiziae]SFK81868.1 localization factor PodJL [Mesorhizobium albiziae]